MLTREVKRTDWKQWGHSREGRVKRCRACGQPIYLKRDWDGIWRPYESWLGQQVDRGEWRRHNCR